MLGPPPTCPVCYGRTFYASRSGWPRRLLAVVFVRPFRCGDCHRRVWRLALRPGPPRPPKAAPRHPQPAVVTPPPEPGRPRPAA